MKRATLMLAALALLLGGVGQARAQFNPQFNYSFTYTDSYGDSGSGTLTTVGSGLGDGSQRAIIGSLDLQSSYNSNAAAGTYTLLTYGSYPASVPGVGPIDNLVYPPPTYGPPYLTFDGLIFGPSSLPSAGPATYINLYYDDSALGYGILSVGSGNSGFFLENGTFTLTPLVNSVPEPSGIALLGLGVVCLAIGYAVRRRKLALVAA